MQLIEFYGDLFSDPRFVVGYEGVLTAMLEALVMADVAYLQVHPMTPPLYASGVRYQREPIEQEKWLSIGRVRAQGWGDCEDLAAWRAAELRRAGVQAKAVFISRVMPSGMRIYHILVLHPSGVVEDPSRVLGMERIT